MRRDKLPAARRDIVKVWVVLGVLALALALGPLLVVGQGVGGWSGTSAAAAQPRARTDVPAATEAAAAVGETPPPVPEAPPAAAGPSPTVVATAPARPTARPTHLPLYTIEPRALGYDAATVAVSVADVWKNPGRPASARELETQVIAGERVVIVGEQGDWYQIVAVEQPSSKNELGYPGWVSKSALVPGWAIARQYAVAMAPLVDVKRSAYGGSETLQQLFLDSRLPVLVVGESWVQVRLPDGRAGWVSLAAVRLAADPDEPVQTGQVLATAAQLLGVAYRWGGTSSQGFDCSGFVYRVFHAHGIRVARDSWDQGAAGRQVASADLQPGDLLFFAPVDGQPAQHVSIYVEADRLLDCGNGQSVAYRTLAEVSGQGVWIDTRTYTR